MEKLIGRYDAALGLDPNVTVHSLRVTALTTARERGSDIIDLQDFAGQANRGSGTSRGDITGKSSRIYSSMSAISDSWVTSEYFARIHFT